MIEQPRILRTAGLTREEKQELVDLLSKLYLNPYNGHVSIHMSSGGISRIEHGTSIK